LNVAGCMANGHLWSVWIDYDGSALHVALADNSVDRPADLINFPVTLGSALKSAAAYVGFTAGTGGGYENQDIISWQYRSTYFPVTGPEAGLRVGR
jgi:hypothetical protein